MEVNAKAKYIRMSPRKVRLVADLIRGMEVIKAIDQLNFINKRAAKPILKLVNSAVANAEHNFELEKSNLLIKEIKVDEGPVLHRWMPRARGRATPIRRASSHINLILGEIVASAEKKSKKLKIEAPVKFSSKPKEEKVEALDKKEAKKPVAKEKVEEKDKKIIDPRREGRRGHAQIEGQGFVKKIFRRKSG